MIFNCPACSAGHSVPVSMIPNGGMEVSCRRCEASFAVDVEDPPVEEDQDATQEGPEATTIGVANPYDELVGEARLIAPSGEIFDPISQVSDVDEDTEALDYEPDDVNKFDRPTRPIDTGQRVPLGPDEVGVDPELDNTQRVDVDEDVPTGEPEVKDITTPPPRLIRPSNPKPASRPNGRSPIDESHDVYAKVASGTYSPTPSVPASATPKEKAWNEPSSLIEVGRGPAVGLRRVAEALNNTPLAFKVALIVFPVALGITLVVTALSQSTDTPVEIAADSNPNPSPEPNLNPDQSPSPSPSPNPSPNPSQNPDSDSDPNPSPNPFEDPAAPEGHAYVQIASTRLRVRASERAPVVARLTNGQIVKRYSTHDDFTLVMVEPSGPVGFVADRLLGRHKPVAALAEQLEFEGCVASGEIDSCLYDAKQQEGTCAEGCVTDRCREACGVAFDRCVEGCNQGKTRRRRPRRRR